ncbi:CatB-related O-acetyltransferase [Planococcus sp. 107-1]|uniref:CatB-related O-acetyltransferase n=1 Tax=Planococcus sp. 107-1 TaxID=2908840 RepID=UPI001F1A8C78|nr:CatB-related O-acetyltransferase [Planococcus sp. 107-1]UJF26165.1 CatB-related O-acetyltransferase [Planococcus sp. 107-1]
MKRIIVRIYSIYLSRKTKSIINRKVLLNRETELEGYNKVGYKSSISNTKIGYLTYIGEHSKLNNCNIGRFCSLADNVQIIVGKHPSHTFVSTHPSFYTKENYILKSFNIDKSFSEISYIDENRRVVNIGNDVWIGSGVKIIDGISIGDGAIIATGAIVTKNVGPFEIWGGVPAKKIKDRFTANQKEQLSQIKWWNRKNEWLKEYSDSFSDIDQFISVQKKRYKI